MPDGSATVAPDRRVVDGRQTLEGERGEPATISTTPTKYMKS
jgi:hypothetical protein